MQPFTVKNVQESYQKQRILTATPTELVVLLYDGIRKNIMLAQRAISRKDMQACHEKLIKAQDIVEELMSSLNLSIPLSNELMRIYEFMLHSLQQANIKKDSDRLNDLLEITNNLREAWQEVSQAVLETSEPEMEQEVAF